MKPLPRVALAQINTTIGDFEGTFRKCAKCVEKAKKSGAEIILFPELTTTGYPPRDLVELPHFVEANLKCLERIAALAQGIDIVVGYVERNEQSGAKPLFNAAALCRNGKVIARYHKSLIPTYDVFDEGRYFEPGTQLGLWHFGEPASMGISICEDSWNDKLFWEKRLYPRDPVEEQVKGEADFLINISASPFFLGKPQLRRDMLQALAIKHGRPLFYVNLVGGNDELVFDGRSMAVDSKGNILAMAKAYEEDLVIVDPSSQPLSTEPISDLEDVFRALVLGVRDYVRKCGFQKVVLGLSGGIDSSLTAVIAAAAIGAKNVMGVSLPSPYTSKESRRDAKLLAKNLGILFSEYPIKTVYESYRRLFKRKGLPDLADENIQARVRGNILMNLSNRHGYLVLSTGNKSELAVGYCTLYGDMSGGLSVISDLPKTLVYELSRYLQKRKKVIPEEVFTKAPTAELRPNQKDQDSLPSYETLDAILKAMIEENKSEEEVLKMGFDRKIVKDVFQRVRHNEYKRRQAAPGIKVTSKAFGIGRRYPIARKG